MRSFGRFCTPAVLGLCLSVAMARADEEKIPLDKVPTPVLRAFKAKFPAATIKGAIKETEKDKVAYEVAVKTPDGKSVEVEVSKDGKVL